MNGITDLIRDFRELPNPFSYVRTQNKESPLKTKKWALTKHQICWHLNFRLLNLQNCEK